MARGEAVPLSTHTPTGDRTETGWARAPPAVFCRTVGSLWHGVLQPLESHPGPSLGDGPRSSRETLLGHCPWLSALSHGRNPGQTERSPTVSRVWESWETHVAHIPGFVFFVPPPLKKNAIQRIVFQRIALEILIPFYSLHSHSS